MRYFYEVFQKAFQSKQATIFLENLSIS